MDNIELKNYVSTQMNNFLPSTKKFEIEQVFFDSILSTVGNKFSKVTMWKDDSSVDVFHSMKYPIFLYDLARSLYLNHMLEEAQKVFYLNKILHSIDLFYEVDFGDHFLLGHSIGSAFCKATYGNYAVFFHNIVVGRNNNDKPILKDGLVMFPGSQIIGKSNVGENVVVSANTTIIDTNIPDNVYVFPGKGKKPILKDLNEYYADRYFIREN